MLPEVRNVPHPLLLDLQPLVMILYSDLNMILYSSLVIDQWGLLGRNERSSSSADIVGASSDLSLTLLRRVALPGRKDTAFARNLGAFYPR
jgi:hypothetical protein